MHPAPILDDSVSMPLGRVGLAALQELSVAVGLLTEAADTLLGADSGAAGIREAVVALSRRVPRLEHSDRGLADAVGVASEIVHLCDALASRNRHSSPAALGCARVAEAGAQLALESLTEERGWTGVEALSRRARQLGEIQALRTRLDLIEAALAPHGVEGTPEGRSFRSDLHRRMDEAT